MLYGEFTWPSFCSLIAGTTALLAMDAGCYLWLRANDARRSLPVRHLGAVSNPTDEPALAGMSR